MYSIIKLKKVNIILILSFIVQFFNISCYADSFVFGEDKGDVDFTFRNEVTQKNIFSDKRKEEEYLIVKLDGDIVKINALDVISSHVASEMGDSFPEEALKAQAIATHTLILRNNKNKQYSVFKFSSPSQKIKKAVSEVLDLVVVENNNRGDNIAFTPYCSSVAGKTNNAMDIWGGKSTASVDSKYDSLSPTYNKQCRYSFDKIKELFQEKWHLNLSDVRPEDMFKVLTKTEAGYNGRMSVGPYVSYYREFLGKKVDITARLIREEVLTELGSPKFDVDYSADTDEFIFVSYGYGHGCGMSQYGAKYYVEKEHWNYEDIIKHYYPYGKIKDIREVNV